jgi:hypothetical protein
MTSYPSSFNRNVEVDSTTVVTPKDRVRFGPVFAGLCALITVFVTLSLLGAALGLSTLDADSTNNNPGAFSAIWGAISILVAFFVGGGTAARTAALPGRDVGALNGAMVFMVAIPILLFLAVSGVGTVLGTFREIATAGIAAAPEAAQAAQGEGANVGGAINDAATDAAGAVEGAVDDVTNASPAEVENVARDAGAVAWTSLLSLGLGLLAATLGGLAGSRTADIVAASRVTTAS